MTSDLGRTGTAALDADRRATVASSVSPDRTATGKQHFEVLDGLRGSAALLVVLYHVQGMTVDFAQDRLLLHHAYLAVDFFFALSGFVIGYAYDDRWGRMGVADFLKARLIRLHPLVVLGVLLGFVSYLVDPFAGTSHKVAFQWLLLALAMGLLLLPSKPLPNRWDDTHTLNGPSWSLLQEYIGNLGYAFALRRLSTLALGLVAVVAGAVLLGCGLKFGNLDAGWGWGNLWMAPVRLCYPFIAGLWLYRVRERLPRLRLGWLPLTVILVAAFSLPKLPAVAGIELNGLYEDLCVLVLFPAIVAFGAHSQAGAGMTQLCKASGRISYPIYITHYPFLYIWMSYMAQAKPSAWQATAIAVPLVAFLILFACAAYKLWDEPIRSRLRKSRA